MSKSAQLIGEIAQFISDAEDYFDSRADVDCIDGRFSPNKEHVLFCEANAAQKNLTLLIKTMHDEEVERVNVALDKAFGK